MNSIPTVLIIGKVWPEPGSSAAGSRMMQLVGWFKKEGWEITFASAAGESEFAEDLAAFGVSVQNIELNSSSFDAFVKALNPDIVLFDRFMTEEQFGWRVTEHCPHAMKILDTEDLHCLRHGRHQAMKEGREFDNRDLLNDYAYREIASIYRCDLSLIISEFEMELLKAFFKVSPELLHYLPFMVDGTKPLEEVPFENRQHFVSIGNFLHEPNWDAVRYLKETIWPMIRHQLPNTELHIYGAYPSQKVVDLHNPKEGFLVKGRAENAEEVISRARVMLAPLRFGAGLKGKLLDAMQCGTPSVTTSIGAEAMHGNLPWPGALENDPEKFAKSATELYSNSKKWEEARLSASGILTGLYSQEKHEKKLLERIVPVKENLPRHRQGNFTGAMLHHHTMASTRFMGKWIEEKNREK